MVKVKATTARGEPDHGIIEQGVIVVLYRFGKSQDSVLQMLNGKTWNHPLLVTNCIYEILKKLPATCTNQ